MKIMPGIFSRFYKKYPIEKLVTMTDEEVNAAVEQYLDDYIESWTRRHPGQDLPEISLSTINDVRNKRTNVSKVPTIIRSNNDKGSLQ